MFTILLLRPFFVEVVVEINFFELAVDSCYIRTAGLGNVWVISSLFESKIVAVDRFSKK